MNLIKYLKSSREKNLTERRGLSVMSGSLLKMKMKFMIPDMILCQMMI